MNNNSNLEFRKIKSLQFLYEVNENGTIFRNVKSKRQLKIKLDMHHSDKGYYTTWVNIKGKVIRVPIHKVVAECWLGDRPDGLEIDHKDRNTHNNHYTNLRYVTHSQQMKNVAKPLKIQKDNEEFKFESMTKCAEYLAQIYQVKPEHIRSKLKKRRKHIYDYDIIYSECRD